MLLQIITYLYTIIGIVGVIAYFPTIHDLLIHKKPSANIWTYFLWTVSTGTSALYSIFILKDTLNIVIISLHFVCCLIIFLACIWHQWKA